jgi:membrane protease YdiL (CAAX protease family)
MARDGPRQDGHEVRTLLFCGDCEVRLNRNGESYVLNLIATKAKRFPLHEKLRLALPRELRYVAYSLAFALAGVAILVIWPPPLEPFARYGSPQQPFQGLGIRGPALPQALLYGVVKTGFSEKLLFRGLIAGSLSRRFSVLWANLGQASHFPCSPLVRAQNYV